MNNTHFLFLVCYQRYQRVRLHFVRFELEQGPDCKYDKVCIYIGSDANAPLIHTLCGNDLPGDTTVVGNDVFVYFKSDNSVQQSGFRILYSIEGKKNWL